MEPAFVALHGFLGKPSDWDAILPGCLVCDLLQFGMPHEIGLQAWARRFNAWIAKTKMPPRVLVGYSLGGRLAMHALLDQPQLWERAVIISAHPGLVTQEEREQRSQTDFTWAQRFESEEWASLMRDWNEQAIFAGDPPLPRKESDYSRQVLADILRHWSLSKQENLHARIEQLSMPILWIAGQRDQRYSAIANSFSFKNRESRIWIAPEASHRVPWQQKAQFQNEVLRFSRAKSFNFIEVI